MNKAYLIGNITRDLELSKTTSGVSVTHFSIAVNRPFVKDDGERETDFFNVTAWRGVAENCVKFLSKGSKVAVVGSLQNRSYEDKDGNKRTVTDVIASEVEFLSLKSTNDTDGEKDAPEDKKSNKKDKSTLTEVTEEDLPF